MGFGEMGVDEGCGCLFGKILANSILPNVSINEKERVVIHDLEFRDIANTGVGYSLQTMCLGKLVEYG